MNYLKNTMVGLALLVLAFSPPAFAQIDPFGAAAARVANGEGFIGGRSAVSTDPVILIKYIGTNANGGTVTVAAGGDITLSEGAVGASAVDASVECDSSIAATGSRSGIFDLSTPHANCDTLGEVVDLINSQVTSAGVRNWVAVIVNGLRSDSTDNTFITLSETAANSVDGLGLLNDGTTLFKQTLAVIPAAAKKLPFYLVGTGRSANTLKTNPFSGLTSVVYSMTATTTYSSGTSSHQIVCVAVTNSLVTGSEVVNTYSKAAGATTVEDSWAPSAYGLSCPRDQKMLVRTVNSAVMSAATLYAAGVVF